KYVLDRHDESFRAGRDRVLWAERERFFWDYLVRYTNAPTLVDEKFQDTEEETPEKAAGLFSGFVPTDGADARLGRYDTKTWAYQPEGKAPDPGGDVGKPHSFSAQVGKLVKPPGRQDTTLQDPRCVFRVLQRHFARYTPEMVEQACGTPRDVFLR